MFHVIVMMCHKRPGVLQVIKVTAHIRATLTKIKVDVHLGAKFLNQN